jgi:uracil-DNA glycosylase
MEESDLIQRIEQLLGPKGDRPGILHRDGRVMMSDWSTVRQSPYYVLAINPGGKEENPAPNGKRIGDSLHNDSNGKWNYWLDEAGAKDRAYYERVMEALNIDARSPPVSNALFLRSRGERFLPADSNAIFSSYCAPIHQLLLGIVKPRVVICFGNQTWEFMVGRQPPNHWKFNANVSFRAAGIDYSCAVLLLPHFKAWAATWKTNGETLMQAIADARAYAG